MYEIMRINNKCDVFGIEKTHDNKYRIYKDDRNAIKKSDAILYDDFFIWRDIEPFKTLQDCYKFMVSHINDLM